MYGEKRGEHKPFCGQESGLHSIIWAAAHSFLPTTSFFLFFLFFHQFCPFGHRGGKFWKSGFPLFSSLKKSNGSQNIPSISKTLKAYLGLHFHTIFDFVCYGISSPEGGFGLEKVHGEQGKTLVNLLSTCQSHRCLPIYPHWANWRSLCARGGEITYKCARISPEGSQTCH